MSAQELIALFRSATIACPACRRIVTRYERTLAMSLRDRQHLEACVLAYH